MANPFSQFANYEHRYADNTHLALPPAAVGRTAVERRPYQADFAKCGGGRRVVDASPRWRLSMWEGRAPARPPMERRPYHGGGGRQAMS